MTDTEKLALQARIRELREALGWILPMAKGYAVEHDVGNNQNMVAGSEFVLSRPDDLSALDDYVREEKRKVLEEAANEFGEAAYIQDGTFVVEVLRNLTEELK